MAGRPLRTGRLTIARRTHAAHAAQLAEHVLRHLPPVAIGHALGTHTRILHAPPVAMEALARALGLVVRDVVLTGDEIRGLTAGLLVSHAPALGRTSFIDWLDKIGPTLGRGYLNELERHFGAPRASAHA